MAKAKTNAAGAPKKNVPKSEMVLDGKGRVRLRKASPKAWTKEKELHFLQALSDTCNVKWAAQEAGVSPQRAYERRKSHAAFRSGWIEAIGFAYGRLELILLNRALNGTERIITRRDGSEERMVDYSNQVALTLLKMHRETAPTGEAQRPPCPVHVRAIQVPAGLEVSWVRRSRHGWAWLDDMDAPLGESREFYRVALEGAAGQIEVETDASFLVFDTAQLATVGAGDSTLSIRQIGDLATSRAATMTINLS
jgi:hypothetical protein